MLNQLTIGLAKVSHQPAQMVALLFIYVCLYRLVRSSGLYDLGICNCNIHQSDPVSGYTVGKGSEYLHCCYTGSAREAKMVILRSVSTDRGRGNNCDYVLLDIDHTRQYRPYHEIESRHSRLIGDSSCPELIGIMFAVAVCSSCLAHPGGFPVGFQLTFPLLISLHGLWRGQE